METLLAAGADPNSGPSDGSGPLWQAVDHLDLPVIRLLLQHGASPASRSKSPGWLPLSAAAGKGSVEIAKLLLEAGAPVNAATAGFGGPLGDAALRGHVEVMKVLIEAGAELNQASRDGFTPLMAAVRSRKKEAVELLLKAGADANRTNNSGEAALDMAKQQKSEPIIALLETAGALSGKQARKAAGKPVAKRIEPEAEEEEPEPPDFSDRQTSEFKAIVNEVAGLSGSAAKGLGDLAGGFSFAVTREQAEKLLQEHHSSLLKRGAYFFRHHRDHMDREDKLGLLPTQDWADLIAAFQTNGANYDLMPADIVKWLKNLEREHPFELTGAGFDWLEGRFLQPISKARTLANRMYKFCPDIVDQGVESVKELGRILEKDGTFFFWWD